MSVAASEGYHATQKKYVYSGSSKGSGRPPRPGLDRPIIRKLLEPIRFLCLSFETNVIPHASLIIAHHRETGKNPLINPDALPFPPLPHFYSIYLTEHIGIRDARQRVITWGME